MSKIFLKNKKAQALVEFIFLAPLLLFIFMAGFKFYDIAIKSQKLEMASYYAVRLYSKYSIRGVSKGSIYNYLDKKERVMNEIVKPRVYKYLGTNEIQVTIENGNEIKLVWPVELSFGVPGLVFTKKIELKAVGAIENDPLEYGGGRNADDLF